MPQIFMHGTRKKEQKVRWAMAFLHQLFTSCTQVVGYSPTSTEFCPIHSPKPFAALPRAQRCGLQPPLCHSQHGGQCCTRSHQSPGTACPSTPLRVQRAHPHCTEKESREQEVRMLRLAGRAKPRPQPTAATLPSAPIGHCSLPNSRKCTSPGGWRPCLGQGVGT